MNGLKLVRNSILIFLLLQVIGCSSIEEPNLQPNEQTYGDTRSVESASLGWNSTVEQRQRIAMWLRDNYSLEEANRIYESVRKALAVGLDEIYYIREYASQNSSANKVSTQTPSKASEAFYKAFNDTPDSRQSRGVDIDGYPVTSILKNEYIQIYWPYSENWDRKTDPVIVYAPEKLDIVKAMGFKINPAEGEAGVVVVDEQYCMTHPVWIINESETPYSELPDFNNGEYESHNGITYSQSITIPRDSLNYQEMPTTLYIGTVRSTKQHDSWIAGGSEYIFRFGSFTNTNLTCEADTNKCQPLISKTKITFTRSEIKNKTTKKLQAIAVSNWPKQLKGVAMTLVEEDSGKENKSYDATLNLSWKNITLGLTISLPFRNHDDFIAERIYSRDFITSTNNKNEDGTWAEDTSDGVYWTLPVKSGFILDDPIVVHPIK